MSKRRTFTQGNESWSRLGESYSDYSPQFNWAALQYAGERLMNVAWITGIQGRRRNHHPNLNRAPNSALSLLREVRYDPAVSELTAQPLDSYKQLRNATLFQAASLPLPPLAAATDSDHGNVTTTRSSKRAGRRQTTALLPLTRGGEAIELRVRFPLPKESGASMDVGVSVLAPASLSREGGVGRSPLLNSTVARVHVGSAASAVGGVRAGNLTVGIERAASDPALPDTWQPWSAPFRVPLSETDVDVVIYVDRSSACRRSYFVSMPPHVTYFPELLACAEALHCT